MLQYLTKYKGIPYKAFIYAARYGHIDIVNWLYNTSIIHYNIDALFLATKHGHLDIVVWFYIKCVDIRIVLDTAKQYKQQHIIDYIKYIS